MEIYKKMRTFVVFFVLFVAVFAKGCPRQKSTSKLICYYSKLTDIDDCYCSHVILPANSDIKSIEKLKEHAPNVKIFITINEFNEGLINILKSSKVDGVEVNLRKLDSKNDITDFISTIKTKVGSDLGILVSIPAKAELLAKYFDFKGLSKYTDLFILQTAFLGASRNVTFHPSRLSGLWDMQNTDSMVDLVSGLGAPLSKLVISAPVQAFHFTLQNKDYTAPGSPALDLKSLTRTELCDLMSQGRNWTLERDEDQAGPYVFSGNEWIAFEDTKSMDIKAKYSRIRGLAGIALKDLSLDGSSKCGTGILEAAFTGLSRQGRAPRGAVLHSLEREILEIPSYSVQSVQVSPYRISRIIDTEGHVHIIRQDTRTEFTCSRQGYFVHPKSCNRFYRCVKFDQLSDEFSVFEFDCPSGLAFDERVEVCVWPGSLPHGTPCSGSSEIAPVPKQRFVCPSEPGYYADPENCRWFFACLDHGRSPLSAYEFRCPFGLVFDGDRLVCEWPWLVPKCANGDGYGLSLQSDYYYGNNEVQIGAGVQNSGQILQNYDGLGQLSTVKLGGISGTIHQPLYTHNVEGTFGGLGVKFGYENNDGYITSNGLGLNAVQSLQNSGLLKVNHVTGAAQLNNLQANGFIQNSLDHANTYVYNRKSETHGNANLYSSNEALNTHQILDQDASLNSANSFESKYKTSSASSQSFINHNQYHNENHYDSNSNYYNEGFKLDSVDQNQQHYHEENFAANANTGLQFGQGTAGSINIFSGGYSSVGVPKSTVPLINSGEDLHPPSLIPSVSPVPLPSISTVNSFKSYKGNVVANLPELQYKVQSSGNAGFQAKTEQGYIYDKPSIPFEETPVKVSEISTLAPSFVTSTEKLTNGGYNYEKPSIQFHEGPIPKPFTLQSASNFSNYYQRHDSSGYGYNLKGIVHNPTVSSFAQEINSNFGYEYPKPLIKFEEKPQEIKPVSFISTTTPPVAPYVYEKPTIPFELNPLVSLPAISNSFPKVNNLSPFVPAVKIPLQETNQTFSSVFNSHPITGYEYPKPNIPFNDSPHKTILTSTYSYHQPTLVDCGENQPVVPITQQPYVPKVSTYIYEKPHVQPVHQPIVELYKQPQLLSTYTYHHKPQQNTFGGYYYPKPSVVFEENPQTFQHKTTYQSNYNLNEEKRGYDYHKPSIPFEESPTNYNVKVPVQEEPFVKKTAYVTGQSYIKSSQEHSSYDSYNSNAHGYNYPRPAVSFAEEPFFKQQEIPFVKKTAYVTGQKVNEETSFDNLGVVENYQVSDYEKVKQTLFGLNSFGLPSEVPPTAKFDLIQTTPRSKYISTTTEDAKNVIDSTDSSFYYYDSRLSSTPQPPPVQPKVEAPSKEYIPVVPKEEIPSIQYLPVRENIAVEPKLQLPSREYIPVTPKVTIGSNLEHPSREYIPAAPKEEIPSVEYLPVRQNIAVEPKLQLPSREYIPVTPKVTVSPKLDLPSRGYVPVAPKEQIEYLPVKQKVTANFNLPSGEYIPVTPRVTIVPKLELLSKEYIPVTQKVTISPKLELLSRKYLPGRPDTAIRPITKQTSSENYPNKVFSTTFRPTSEYVPVTPTVRVTQAPKIVESYVASGIYLPATNSRRPSEEYLPVEVTTPANTYIPAPRKSTVAPEVTTLSREYLPVRSKVRITTTEATLEPVKITTRRPIEVSRPQKIIKQNDFHPLLSAKLGAQCTCVSNSRRTGKKKKVIVIEEDEDDDDGYLVKPDDFETTVVENYTYKQDDVVEITPISTTEKPDVPKYEIRTKIKVRPVTTTNRYLPPVSNVREIFNKNVNLETTTASDREIANAVRTGLKLVKQAAKEGTEEALSKSFDRYGPGGVRSKNERLQGTVDCQRAGLFRHPTQCNKFYACRWDCTKNRFTLHVFNCPVHLTFDNNLGACNWPSQGPACVENTLINAE